MLRFLLKLIIIAWFASTAFLLVALNLGRTAPQISSIAFFSQEFNSTEYWHLDMWTGVAFKTDYRGHLALGGSPVQHFLLLDSSSDFSDIYELNPQTETLSFIGSYWIRHNRMSLAGDYVFLMDYGNHWTRINIETAEMTVFGDYPDMQNLRVSPDGQWLAGEVRGYLSLFINTLDNRSYELAGVCCVRWSPDSQWFLVSDVLTATVYIFSSEDGTSHPSFPQRLAAGSARWSHDGQAIYFYPPGGSLSRIALDSNAIYEYSNHAEAYQLNCLSPNERYLLSWNFETFNYNMNLAVEDLETGAKIWSLLHRNFSGWPQCLWSADSRYLVFHATVADNGISAQRFFLIDTVSHESWDLAPENLLNAPIYLHIQSDE